MKHNTTDHKLPKSLAKSKEPVHNAFQMQKLLNVVKVAGRKLLKGSMLSRSDIRCVYGLPDPPVHIVVTLDDSQVHYSYGEELGLSTDDEMDYIAPDDLTNCKVIDMKALAEVSKHTEFNLIFSLCAKYCHSFFYTFL